MPKNITVYRVFIGSPGGLEAERRRFREVLDKFNRKFARRHYVEFEPVGWEDTLPGVGRPQAQINEDLEECDYAVFAFHDRWGSKTGNGDLVGTEEEWQIAQHLYSAKGGYKIRQIALYFKDVPAAQLKDPGDELKKVIAFKQEIFGEKQHLCGAFADVEAFADKIEHHLSDWLAKHLKPAAGPNFSVVSESNTEIAEPESPAFKPDFNFWYGEFYKELGRDAPDWVVALTYIDKAITAADTENQKAFALYNKGVVLGKLDRSAEAIAVHDDLIADFSSHKALVFQVRVAKALYAKGFRLGTLDRSEEEIAVYDDLIERFADSDSDALQEQVAMALINKGITLGTLDRSAEEMATYDELVTRFGDSDIDVLKEQLARALINKGFALGKLNRSAEAIAVYEDVIARFGSSEAVALQEQVAIALCNKGVRLSTLNRSTEEIAVYDDLIARFGDSAAEALQGQVAKALLYKGITLGTLDRSDEEIAVYDDLIGRFGNSEAQALHDLVTRALFNKGCALARLGRISDCIVALDQWADKRGGFDCEEVAKDSDFDAIRQRPMFVRYLKSKGCVT